MEVNEIYETYKLPEIKREGLTEVEYEHRCKYLRLYIRIIERCKNMTEEELSGYCEVHHILPSTLGGEGKKINLIKLPVRYHIMEHIILVEIYPYHRGLRYALSLILSEGETNNQIMRVKYGISKFSTKYIARLREEANMKLKELGRSEEHKRKLSEANKGKRLSEETKRKISESGKGLKRSLETRRKISEAQLRLDNPRRGRKLSDEIKKKMSNSHMGHPGIRRLHTEEEKQKISNTLKNKHLTYNFSEEHRKKLSESRKGRKISEKTREALRKRSNTSSKIKVISPKGVEYNSIKEAAMAENVSSNSISKWITNNKNGWSSPNRDEYMKKKKASVELNNRKIIDNNTGKIYNNLKEASDNTGFDSRTIKSWITNKLKYDHGWSLYNNNE